MNGNVTAYSRINVALCDPCPMIFSGLQKSFEKDDKIRIVDETSTLRALRQKVAAGGVHIALIDWSIVNWHDNECVRLMSEICSNSLLALLGMTEGTNDRKLALEFGARGIISKRSNAAQIRRALLRVADGGIWLEKTAAETLLNHVFLPASGPQDETQRIELLTRREREVIALVCRSLRNKEIASALCISESTVWHHLTSVFTKLKVADRVSLVTFAFRHNLSLYIEKPTVPKFRANPAQDNVPIPSNHVIAA